MSRKYQLTWNSKQARWFKRLDGKQYAVSCKALQADYPHLYQSATKEGSYKAANQWWLDRLADLTTHPQHAIYQEAIELRRYMALWCELEGDEDSRLQALAEMQTFRQAEKAGEQLVCYEGLRGRPDVWYLASAKLYIQPGREEVKGSADQGPYVIDWMDRIEEAKKHAQWSDTQDVTSLATLIDKYLALKEKDVSPQRLSMLRVDLEQFADSLGVDNAKRINPLALQEHKAHLQKNFAPVTAASKLKHVKTFVSWLSDFAQVIDIRSSVLRKLTISVPHKTPPTWTDEQFKLLMDETDGQQKLCYLLMANCGMYSGDIGQLRKDEIDLQAGTIERARSKNKDKGGRVVTYKLWPETLRLLKAHLSTHPTLALSTQYGTALCRTEAKANGKPKHTDNISQQYRTWCRNNGHQLPRLKDLRKTGATLITNEYGKPLADYYLSRGLQDLSDVSYIAHQNDELAKALTWLGERYGQ